MKNLAPIVLFTYNRLWHTQQTIEALQKNELSKESELFIYSDGGRDENSWINVNEIRKYLKTIIGFKNITIIEQKENLGLANSIIAGVTEIINNYGKIIVLEDDIVTSPYFLKYMNDSLNFYEKEENVWHISSYVFPMENTHNLPETFFIKPTSCWGWATWKNRWIHFKNDSSSIIQLFSDEMIFDFNLNGSYNYWSHLLLNHTGKLKTWAIFWYACVYLNNGLSLHPKQSFTYNIGHDGSGENCGKNIFFNLEVLNLNENILFDTNYHVNNDCQKAIETFFNKLRNSQKV